MTGSALRPAPSPERLIVLTRAYLTANYRWRHRDAWHALTVGAPAPDLERIFPAARAFAVLTAWNPHSVARDAAANTAADAALRRDLDAAGLLAVPADSSSPMQDWREPGWLLSGLAHDACDALARRHGQLGSLWWRRGEAVGLRIDATRPAAFEDDARVAWIGAATP